MCFSSQKAPEPAKPAVAPPAPEPTPEEILPPEDTTVKSQEKKQTKIKAKGLDAYKTDNEIKSGLNVSV